MGAAQFFVEGAYAAGQTVEIAGGDAHKIVHVLRKRSGDRIEVVDSCAHRFEAALAIDGDSVRAVLGASRAQAGGERLHIAVAQGVPKGHKMDFVVEKLTELGASAIVPFSSERSVVLGAGENKVERWRRLARTAAAQSGRDTIPDIASPITFDELLESFTQYDRVLFPWELAVREEPLNAVLPKLLENARRILVVIGPEGGFSHGEADRARACGAHVIGLGSRILRTETAALVVLALLNYVAGV
jgi:16S rRNA (uracil1498-N3)-methyltransferase